MDESADPPAKNTRSNQKVVSLSPTSNVCDTDAVNTINVCKRLVLTPIPKDHLRSLSVDRGCRGRRLTTGERQNEIILERRASRSRLQQHREQSKGKTIHLSKSTLDKLKQFRSPSFDRRNKQEHEETSVTSSNTSSYFKESETKNNIDLSIHSIITDNSFVSCSELLNDDVTNFKCTASNQTQGDATLKRIRSTGDTDSDPEITFQSHKTSNNKMSGIESLSDSDHESHKEGGGDWATEMDTEDTENFEVALPTLPDDASPSEKVMYEMLRMIQCRMTAMEVTMKKNGRDAKRVRAKNREMESRLGKVEEKLTTTDQYVSQQNAYLTHILKDHQDQLQELRNQIEETNYRLAQEVISIDGILEQNNENTIQLGP